MSLIRKTLYTLILSVTLTQIQAQDTLPRFTVKNRFGKVIVSWVNPFDSMVQLNIQRSPDSLRNFKTILTVPDPTTVTNGYLDSKTPDTKQFYRIFVMRSNGRYFFTRSSRPVVDSSRESAKSKPAEVPGTMVLLDPKKPKPANVVETKRDTVVFDPISGTKRTYKIARIVSVPGNGVAGELPSTDGLIVKAPETRPVYTPSVFVFSNQQGDVEIALPESKVHNFSLKFYSEDGKPLFAMNKIRDSHLTMDKSNFIKAGWVQFELYEDGKIKEKHKLYIPKDR